MQNPLCPWHIFIDGKTKKGGTVMFNYPYFVELLSPKRSAEDQIETLSQHIRRNAGRLQIFAELIDVRQALVGLQRWGVFIVIGGKKFEKLHYLI